MAFTDPLFSDGLDNSMAGGPTMGLFKNPDGTYAPGSGVVPPPGSPEAGAVVSTQAEDQAATTLLTAQAGTGSDPATIAMLNTAITAVNAALTILNANIVKANANAVKSNDNSDALTILNNWAIRSGEIKPPAA